MDNDDLSSLNITDGDVIHRQKIVQILKVGIAQQWSFSYVKKIKSRIITNTVRMVSVHPEEGLFSFKIDSGDTQYKPGETLMFRGQSGGLSIVFQASVGEVAGEATSNIYYQLPYKIACTQLRKTLRVNLEGIMQVPVTLYMVNGAIVEASVMDISSSGAKFRAEQNLEKELRNPELIDACKIDFSDDFELQCGIQLIGMINDQDTEVSFLRCQFIHLKSADEDKLESFIDDALQKAENVESAIVDQ